MTYPPLLCDSSFSSTCPGMALGKPPVQALTIFSVLGVSQVRGQVHGPKTQRHPAPPPRFSTRKLSCILTCIPRQGPRDLPQWMPGKRKEVGSSEKGREATQMCFPRTPSFPLPLANFTHQDSFTSVQKPRLPLQVHFLPSCLKSLHGALDQILPQPHPALCSSPPRLPQSCSSCSLSLISGPWQQATPVSGLRSSPPPWSSPDPALIPLRLGPKAVPRRGAPCRQRSSLSPHGSC